MNIQIWFPWGFVWQKNLRSLWGQNPCSHLRHLCDLLGSPGANPKLSQPGSVPPSALTCSAVGAPLPRPSAEGTAWLPSPGNGLPRTNLTDHQWKCWWVILSAMSLRYSRDMVTSPCVMRKKQELGHPGSGQFPPRYSCFSSNFLWFQMSRSCWSLFTPSVLRWFVWVTLPSGRIHQTSSGSIPEAKELPFVQNLWSRLQPTQGSCDSAESPGVTHQPWVNLAVRLLAQNSPPNTLRNPRLWPARHPVVWLRESLFPGAGSLARGEAGW